MIFFGWGGGGEGSRNEFVSRFKSNHHSPVKNVQIYDTHCIKVTEEE